jgi:hypothetical protein
MSILSSKAFRDGYQTTNVVEDSHFVQVEFEKDNTEPSYPLDAGTVTVGQRNYEAISTASYLTAHQLKGYRFFFKRGVLVCTKLELPDFRALTVQDLNFVPKDYLTESPCLISHITYSVRNPEILSHVQGAIVELAKKNGIEVPEKFLFYGEAFNGWSKCVVMTALDWLAYPLIREIDSVALTRNLTDMDRHLVSPARRIPLGFKDTVEYYYGTSTAKLLKELWRILTIGSEIKRTNFALDLPESRIADLMQREIESSIIGMDTHYIEQHGNKHLNGLVFTLFPAVYKCLGFDYLYQLLAAFKPNNDNRLMREEMGIENFESHLKVLLKYIGVKKLVSLIPSNSFVGWVSDTVRMLQQYDSQEKIPNSIKHLYPNGITVNFKFKNMKELHDKISAEYTIIKAEADKKEIPVHELYAKLDQRELRGLKLLVPTNSSLLSRWGKALNICIASYGDRAANAETLLLGVEKEGQIKYCIEFKTLITAKCMDFPVMQIEKDGESFPAPIESNMVRLPLPKLLEKELVSPIDQDVTIYLTPSTVQFRGDRNGDPTPEDKDAVYTMLTNWVQENLEEFKAFGNKILDKYEDDTYRYRMEAINANGQPVADVARYNYDQVYVGQGNLGAPVIINIAD